MELHMLESSFRNDVMCRVCLSRSEDLLALFEDNSIIQQIEYCTGLLLSQEPNLPSHICRSCLANLHTAHTFKTTCLSSHYSLHSQAQHASTFTNNVPANLSVKMETDECKDLDGDSGAASDWSKEGKKRKRVRMKKETEDRGKKNPIKQAAFNDETFTTVLDIDIEEIQTVNTNTNSEEFNNETIPGSSLLSDKKTRKRSKNGSSNRTSWEINRVRKARETGRSYLSQKRLKGIKVGFETRKERVMGPPCNSTYCQRSAKRKCKDITYEHRKYCFDKFWSQLNWIEKKIYINDLVETSSCNKKVNSDSRRKKTVKYFLEVNNQCWPVCRKMFLSTFSIGEQTVHGWIDKIHELRTYCEKNKKDIS